MSQSIRVRQWHQQTLVLLHKTTQRVILDAQSAPQFSAMLAQPYPLEAEAFAQLRDLRPVSVTVGLDKARRVVLGFSHAASVMAMDAAGALDLARRVDGAQMSVV